MAAWVLELRIAEYRDQPEFWTNLSRNPRLPLSYVQKHPGLPWNWRALSGHPRLTMDVVAGLPSAPWDARRMYMHPNMQLADFTAGADIDWDAVSWNPNITWLDVVRHVDRPWNWLGLSMNANLEFHTVCAHVHWPWDWSILTHRFSKHILEHPHLPWDWTALEREYYHAQNSSEACQAAHPLPKPEDAIADPTFLSPTPQEARRHMAAKRICRQLFESFTNPQYALCRHRLAKELLDSRLQPVSSHPLASPLGKNACSCSPDQ